MADELFYSIMVTAGNERYDLSKDLSSLTVEEVRAQADQLTLNLSDPYKVFSHALQGGMEVEVDIGTVKDHSMLFRGRIYRVTGDFPRDSVPTLVVYAHDNSMKMGLRRRSRSWAKGITLQEIVEQIAADHGFTDKDIKPAWNPKFEDNGFRQANKTDLDFLLGLAADHACEMYVETEDKQDKFVFKSLYEIMQPDPKVTLYYGRCGVSNRLLTFQPESHVNNIRLECLFFGTDAKTGQRIEPTTSLPQKIDAEDLFLDENLDALAEKDSDKASKLRKLIAAASKTQEQVRKERGKVDLVVIPTLTTAENLKNKAKHEYNLSALGMQANGSTPGNHRIHAQSSIGIADAGRFSGKWFLSNVKHILDNTGYRTEFECQR